MFHHLTHGTPGLLIAYLIVLVPTLIGLLRGNARASAYLKAMPLAAVMMLLAMLLISLLSFVPLLGGSVVRTVLGCFLSVSFGFGLARSLLKPPDSDPVHRRGAFVLDSSDGPTPTRQSRVSAPGVTLAGIPVSLEDETKHFKLIGTTGTGKSTAIRELLTAALARGDRAIIADPDGGYLDRFYDRARGDVILNPFDPSACKWDLFGEIVNDYDVEQLARSLIPDGGDPDRVWCEYARTFFTDVVRQLMVGGVRNDAELYQLVKAAPAEELRLLLAGTASGPFLELGNEKMFGSIRSVASSALRTLQYTTRQIAPSFSVRGWVRNGASTSAQGRGGVLFLPYKAGEIAALRSVISAWMRLGIFEAMDRAEGDQRLWFVVDELDALGEIDGLKDALARLRKFGGRCVLGFQSIAQVSGLYGRGMAETIVENCGNSLILRCSASERGGTAEFVSKLIGQREVMHATQTVSRAPGQWRSSVSNSQLLKIEPAVMASEVERLPDLAGFVKIASRPDWHRVRLTPVAAPFVSRRPPRSVAEPPASEVTSASVSAPTPKQPMSAAKYAAKRPRKAKTPATGASDADAQQLPLGGSLPALNSDSSAVQHHGGGAESPP